MDGDSTVNVHEIVRNVESAEVLTVFFPVIRKALLVDTRCDAVEGPLVKVVSMVNSVEERFRSLKKLRPQFSRPESITFIGWPKHVSSLESLGIWDKISARLRRMGYHHADEDCESAFGELLDFERQEYIAAIKGAGYKALWERRG